MILDYSSCDKPPGITINEIRTIFLGPAGGGNNGIAKRWNQCSYGWFTYNATAFKTIVVKPKNCTTAVTATCSWWGMSVDADIAAREILGDAAFVSYTNYIYVVPPDLQSVCTWSGLALLPGRQIWLQTSPTGVRRWATVMQETLHNYGRWGSGSGSDGNRGIKEEYPQTRPMNICGGLNDT